LQLSGHGRDASASARAKVFWFFSSEKNMKQPGWRTCVELAPQPFHPQDNQMTSDYPGYTARIAGHPILRILVSFPIACFCCALVTDIVYAFTADMLWSDFSDWLLAVGVILGLIAAIAGIVDLIADRRVRIYRPIVPLVIGSVVVLALAILNNFVHSRDAWTSVVPEGLALSAITVVAIIITAWLGAGTTIGLAQGVAYTGVRS